MKMFAGMGLCMGLLQDSGIRWNTGIIIFMPPIFPQPSESF
jgi:hypothetical protein